ncbi:MAG: hypothetical protein LJE84_08480 [Gammaproteobacteria bacterium]|jgi:hypothetical protein|nr:hypothetical protein [Gammaproteobacteria bacterium]
MKARAKTIMLGLTLLAGVSAHAGDATPGQDAIAAQIRAQGAAALAAMTPAIAPARDHVTGLRTLRLALADSGQDVQVAGQKGRPSDCIPAGSRSSRLEMMIRTLGTTLVLR